MRDPSPPSIWPRGPLLEPCASHWTFADTGRRWNSFPPAPLAEIRRRFRWEYRGPAGPVLSGLPVQTWACPIASAAVARLLLLRSLRRREATVPVARKKTWIFFSRGRARITDGVRRETMPAWSESSLYRNAISAFRLASTNASL